LQAGFFGYNAFTRNDTRYGVPRLFFYTVPKPLECFFNASRFMYTVKVPKRAIYDIRRDALKLKEKFTDITALLEYIKLHYKGVLYNVGFDVVCLFDNIKPIKKDVLK